MRGKSPPHSVRRPRARFAAVLPGGPGTRPGGTTAPVRGASLTARVHRGTRKRGPELSHRRRRMARAAAERRNARRPASWAGHLRRSGDRSAREMEHGVRRIRISACRRPAPLTRWGVEPDEGHHPAPCEKPGGGALAFSTAPCFIDHKSGEPWPKKPASSASAK